MSKAKKLIALSLAIIMVLSLVACSGSSASGSSSTAPSAAASASAPAASASPSSGQKYTLKLGYSTGGVTKDESPTVMWGDAFKEKLEKLTNGNVIVEIYPGGQLGTDKDTTGAVAAGSVEMSVQAMSVLANYEKKLMSFDLAGVYDSVENGQQNSKRRMDPQKHL